MDEGEKRALRVLRDALDVDAADRVAFVLRECGDDEELRARVERRLARAEVAADEPQVATDWLLGTRLGAFRVVERIGRGGMGVVYRGERADGDFAQCVAIKLIRRGFDFDDVRARFLRERRILARLDHPNLARLIDGGVAPDGRPWLALEFVRGRPINAWCDAQALPLRVRVRLFLDVCAAVQYAHTQLVVHRDLKPGNLLVDERGGVRLLDFGIAGLLGGGTDDGVAPTTFGSRLALTPEYAAPEQFRGEPAGVAADVYSLGVILYELVAGALPFAFARHDPAAAEAAVCHQPPPSLTATLARDGAEAARARLAARRSTLRAWRADVRGDLARIVEKALAKEPAQRYATVAAFADDLERWLAGVPVRVVGNGWRYRLGKFVQRNRVPVALSLVFAGVLAFAGAYAVQRTYRERLQAERADASLRFLREIFQNAAPSDNGGVALTAPQLLERAADVLRADPTINERSRVVLLNEVAATLLSMGEYERADTYARQAFALSLPLARAHPQQHLQSVLNRVQVFNEAHDYQGMRGLLDEALPLAAATPDGEWAWHATFLRWRGSARSRLGDAAGAEADLRTAIAALSHVRPPWSREVTGAYNELAILLLDTGHAREALLLYWRVLLSDWLGPDADPVDRMIHIQSIARVYYNLGEIPVARGLLELTQPRLERLGGAAHPRVAGGRSLLAQCLANDGDYARAITLIDANLAHAETAPDRLVRGKLEMYSGRFDVALADVLAGLAALGEDEGPTYARARAMWMLGETQLRRGETRSALAALTVALEVAQALSPDAPTAAIGEAQDSLGRAWLAAGDYAAARTHLDAAVEQFSTAQSPGSRSALRSAVHRAWLGVLESGDGAAYDAIVAQRAALVAMLGSADHPVIRQLDRLLDDIAPRAGRPRIDATRRERGSRILGLNSFS